MKTKLVLAFFCGFLCFSAASCSGGMARPTSGLDVSALPGLLSMHPSPEPQATPARTATQSISEPAGHTPRPAEPATSVE